MDQLSKLRQAKQIEERLGKLPKTLNAAYEEVFQTIEENGEAEILERAVKWIMCAQGHLTTGEILDVIRLSPRSDGSTLCMDPIIAEETLLGICGHLVVKDSHSKTWKFPHASVIEYFEEVHQWNLERAHSFVARICLLYLIDDETTRKAKRQWSTNNPEYPKHSRDICPYILGNWFIHVLAFEKPGAHEVEISKLLESFLGIDKSPRQSSQYYQNWLHPTLLGHTIHRRWHSMFQPLGNFYPFEDSIFGICIFGFYYLLQDYWKSEIDVLSVNAEGLNLLSIAAQRGHLKICEKLIELGSDVNRRLNSHPDQSTALTVAVKKGNVDMVRYLISQGADPNLPLTGSSALCASIDASPDSNLECTEILLDAKADLNRPCGPRCEFTYALEFTVLRRNIDAAKFLLRKGADVNLLSETGDYGSALVVAAHLSNEDKCKLLIEYGADVNADLKVGIYGSALVAAAVQNNDQICKLLIDHGADVNANLKVGRFGSALVAAASQNNDQICKLLIEHGADINANLTAGIYGSALAAAALRGNFVTCLLLINHGADINASLSGEYPSALAAAEGGGKRARRVYKLLSRLGAKVTTDISSLPSESNIGGELLPDIAGIPGSSFPISMLGEEDGDSSSSNASIADSLDLHRQRLGN